MEVDCKIFRLLVDGFALKQDLVFGHSLVHLSLPRTD
jgi:hypothetical protein